MAQRDDVVIATKVLFRWSDTPNRGGLSRKHILAAIDGSLRRLGMDYVDLYQTPTHPTTTQSKRLLDQRATLNASCILTRALLTMSSPTVAVQPAVERLMRFVAPLPKSIGCGIMAVTDDQAIRPGSD